MTEWMEAGNRRREDSGLIDLDALMRQANAAVEESVEESGERPIVKVATPPPPPRPAPIETESAPAVVAAIPKPPRVPEADLSKVALEPDPDPWARQWSRPFVAVALTVALFGAGFYGWKHGRATMNAPEPVSVATPREPATTAAARVLDAPKEQEEKKEDKESPPSASDLPSAPIASASSTVALAKPAPAARPEATAVVTTTELIPEAEPARANDLGRAMHDAVGDGSSRVAKSEAAKNDGARTVRPSPGAVIGALNAVLPAARECLGPDDAIRVGTVTFRSDGAVAKVELSGQRASDECVKGAIARAHVEPFADEVFTTRITVRP